ncbi:MAG: hypothetical protein Kow00108_08340 [Calditrichia bacterium]
MQFIDEHTLLIFFLQVLVLLFLARLLGELFSKLNLPEVAGEIVAGLLLGGLVFGKLFPELHSSIFPESEGLFFMLETLSWIGVLFLLLIAGLEIDLSNVVKHQKSLITASISTLGLPMVVGTIWGLVFVADLAPQGTNPVVFALFLGIASGIAAVPVIAKILHDMNMLKSDVGFLSLSVATVGDLIGWTFFTVILGLVAEQTFSFWPAFRIIFLTLLFIFVSLTIGRRLVNNMVKRLAQSPLPKTKSMLTFVFVLALFMGLITQWIGIHGLFGFFIAGILLGESTYLDENARETIKQVIFSFFAPIFFANIGLKIHIHEGFNLGFVIVLLIIAMGGKFLGGFLGTRYGGLSKNDALLAGAALSPGGAMEIVLALLALEYKLINMEIFVAIVLMAVISSILAGPLVAWLARREKRISIANYFSEKLFFSPLESKDKNEALRLIADKIGEAFPELDNNILYIQSLERERLLSTGMEKGLALPHVRIKNLETPLIAYAHSKEGIDWNSLDGLPAHHIYFILTPEEDPGYQTRIISRIAGMYRDGEFCKSIDEVKDFKDFIAVINATLEKLEKDKIIA